MEAAPEMAMTVLDRAPVAGDAGRVAGWPGGRVAGWPGGRVAGWPAGRNGRIGGAGAGPPTEGALRPRRASCAASARVNSAGAWLAPEQPGHCLHGLGDVAEEGLAAGHR